MTHSIRNRVRRTATTWVPTCADRAALIDHILKDFHMDGVTRQVVAHDLSANGRVLWAVEEYGLPGQALRRWLSCYALRRSKTRRGSTVTSAWGFRVTTERRGPWHTDCPMHLLELAPEANRRWRERVRAGGANEAIAA